MIKYDVKIGFYHFVFDNGAEALAFAKVARQTITRDDRNAEIRIELVNEKAEETAENKEEK